MPWQDISTNDRGIVGKYEFTFMQESQIRADNEPGLVVPGDCGRR